MAADLIRIIGIGNPLMGDDGIGIHAIEQLRKVKLPAAVELIDAGCGGLDLLPLFEGCRRLILIDAADFGAAAGQIREIGNQDLHHIPRQQEKLSGHQLGLAEILQLIQQMGQLPKLRIFLMQIKSCRVNSGLSAEVTAAIPDMIQTITETLLP